MIELVEHRVVWMLCYIVESGQDTCIGYDGFTFKRYLRSWFFMRLRPVGT